jgi:hypothetical protein
MIDCYVHGIGLWRPGVTDFAAWKSGEADASISKPTAGLLAGPLKRRASLLTRMAIEVFEQAARAAGSDMRTVKSVWAIAHGEIHTAVSLMGMMHTGEGKLSPTKFHNSVYNTASGYASIATQNHAPSTTLSGGPELVGAALLEAAGLLAAQGGEVIVVWADEPPPEPFELAFDAAPLAVALHLSSAPENALAVLHALRLERAGDVAHSAEDIAIANVLPLLRQIAQRKPGSVNLQRAIHAGERVWKVDVGFGDET